MGCVRNPAEQSTLWWLFPLRCSYYIAQASLGSTCLLSAKVKGSTAMPPVTTSKRTKAIAQQSNTGLLTILPLLNPATFHIRAGESASLIEMERKTNTMEPRLSSVAQANLSSQSLPGAVTTDVCSTFGLQQTQKQNRSHAIAHWWPAGRNSLASQTYPVKHWQHHV